MKDFRTQERAVQAHRFSWTKTLVFVLPGRPSLGPQAVILRFPHEGTIVEAYASIITPGFGRLAIGVEKCSQDSYDSGSPVWSSVLNPPIVVDASERTSKTSDEPYTVTIPGVNQDDHFRVNIIETDENIVDLEVQVTIKLK